MLYFGLVLIFSIGYLAIIFEKYVRVNKAAVAILTGVLCWLYYNFTQQGNPSEIIAEIASIAQIIFFLLAAMAIVELIDLHHGFKLVTDIIYTSSKYKMLWFLILISFFMSSILDNLTSLIVMVSLLRKLIPERQERWVLGSLIVIAVNAGGAWTPIGDVTTTLLWVNNKISTWQTIKTLFIPSFISVLVAGFLGMTLIRSKEKYSESQLSHKPMEPGAKQVLFIGVAALVMIPLWKALFNLPPFMGALIGLGALWLATDLMHHRFGPARHHLRVPHVLTRIDVSSVLFFLGILLAVSSLSVSGVLPSLAHSLERLVPNQNYVAVLIGLVSSVVDNIPLVAATLGMYDPALYPLDHPLWLLLAFAAGTGGSILIIGSAAGVALMGLEKVDFLWYCKYITWIAFVSYMAGIAAYFLLQI